MKHGFTLKIKDSKARKLLSDANTIKECIALSCKFGGANYAVLENGKCHVINCKKNACELKKDVKSKQRVVSFTRKVKVNLKKNKTQHKKRKYKKSESLSCSQFRLLLSLLQYVLPDNFFWIRLGSIDIVNKMANVIQENSCNYFCKLISKVICLLFFS